MKIASWNVAGGHKLTQNVKDASGYEKEDLGYFIQELKKINVDVICLQETHTSVDETVSQGEKVAKNLGFNFVNHAYTGGESHIKKGQRLSLTTLSRFPITKSYFHQAPNPHIKITRPDGFVWVSLNVGFLIAEIDYEGVKVNITNTHLVPFHYYGRDFMEFEDVRNSITKLLLDLSSEPTISAGDFNYEDLRQLFPKVFDAGYQQAFEQDTTPEKGQQDHILYSKQWKLEGYEIIKAQADHYICVAKLKV